MKRLILFAFLSIIVLAGCAHSRSTLPPLEALECPANYFVVCKGGKVSRIENADQRDPRYCSCQPGEHIN